ncbi:hypothetical protein CSE6_036_47690 [Comamonas sp. E6]|nr:hypothetical protein CSE6_036_47690 [Comamonas sp. E6]
MQSEQDRINQKSNGRWYGRKLVVGNKKAPKNRGLEVFLAEAVSIALSLQAAANYR